MTRDTIYRDILLEHARHPKNSGRLENPGLSASVHNPLCGDELELTLALSGELIQDCRTIVRGCSICQASASIMSEMIIKKTLKDAIKTGRIFDESLRTDNENFPDMVEPLRPFTLVPAGGAFSIFSLSLFFDFERITMLFVYVNYNRACFFKSEEKHNNRRCLQ